MQILALTIYNQLDFMGDLEPHVRNVVYNPVNRQTNQQTNRGEPLRRNK